MDKMLDGEIVFSEIISSYYTHMSEYYRQSFFLQILPKNERNMSEVQVLTGKVAKEFACAEALHKLWDSIDGKGSHYGLFDAAAEAAFDEWKNNAKCPPIDMLAAKENAA